VPSHGEQAHVDGHAACQAHLHKGHMRGVLGGRVQRGRHAHQKLALFNKKPLRMHSQAVRHTPSLTAWRDDVGGGVQALDALRAATKRLELPQALRHTGTDARAHVRPQDLQHGPARVPEELPVPQVAAHHRHRTAPEEHQEREEPEKEEEFHHHRRLIKEEELPAALLPAPSLQRHACGGADADGEFRRRRRENHHSPRERPVRPIAAGHAHFQPLTAGHAQLQPIAARHARLAAQHAAAERAEGEVGGPAGSSPARRRFWREHEHAGKLANQQSERQVGATAADGFQRAADRDEPERYFPHGQQLVIGMEKVLMTVERHWLSLMNCIISCKVVW